MLVEPVEQHWVGTEGKLQLRILELLENIRKLIVLCVQILFVFSQDMRLVGDSCKRL